MFLNISASWRQPQENMSERCSLSQLNALFAEGGAYTMAQNWGHKFESWATNRSIVTPVLGSESGRRFGATKHKQTGAIQSGQQVCSCGRKLTAAHIRDTVYIYIHIYVYIYIYIHLYL